MAPTSQWVQGLEFDDLFNATTTGRSDLIDEWMRDYVVETTYEQSAFMKAIGKGKGGMQTFEPGQVKQMPFMRTCMAAVNDAGGGNYTMTFATINGEAVDADLLRQYVGYNRVLETTDSTTGAAIQVVLTADTVAATMTCAAYANTAIASIADSVNREFNFGTKPGWVTEDFGQPVDLPREIEHTYTGRFRRYIQITEDEKIMRDKVQYDSLEKRVRLALDDLALEKAWVMMNGRPRYENGAYVSGYKTNKPSMPGIRWWAEQGADSAGEIYVNCNNQPLTPEMIKTGLLNLRRKRFANFDRGKWAIWFDPVTRQYADDWEKAYKDKRWDDATVGVENNQYRYRGRDYNFMEDMQWPANCVGIFDSSALTHGNMKNGEMKRKKHENQGVEYEQWSIYEHCWGLLPEYTGQILWFYNIRTYGS